MTEAEFLGTYNYPGAVSDSATFAWGGPKLMFRGSESANDNVDAWAAIQDGRLDISSIKPNGATENDVIIRLAGWRSDDIRTVTLGATVLTQTETQDKWHQRISG